MVKSFIKVLSQTEGDSVQLGPTPHRMERDAGSFVEPDRSLHLLPGPLTAAECAAAEASLNHVSPNRVSVRARVFAGVGAASIAVMIPDVSLGAMGSSLMLVDIRDSEITPSASTWKPAAAATRPVHVQAKAIEEIAPASITVGSRSRSSSVERTIPLDFIGPGSERFEIAFANVDVPSAQTFTVSHGFPDRPDPIVRGTESAIRTHIIDVPQISDLPAAQPPNVDAPAPSSLAAGTGEDRSVAMSSDAVAAAFMGTLDVSRGALPVGPASQPDLPDPDPDRAPLALAVPIPARPQSLSANRLAQTELVPKTRLDARVNGVLTGSVEFQQLDDTIAIRLGSVVDMLRDRYSASELAAISGASALNSYITLAELQLAGIPISYNPAYDEIEFGIDYDDAPQAAKVQVEQIGAPTLDEDRALIDQIPR